MLALALAFLKSRLGMWCVAGALVAGAIGVQTWRADHYRGADATDRASLLQEQKTSAALRLSVSASEAGRKAEFAGATAGAAETETACLARVAAAQASAGRIRNLMEKPRAIDPKTGCPVRALLDAGQLRAALEQPAP